MRGIILFVAVLAVLLVAPVSAQHVSLAVAHHQMAAALPPTAEATNGLLGALLLTLSITTLYLLARRRELR